MYFVTTTSPAYACVQLAEIRNHTTSIPQKNFFFILTTGIKWFNSSMAVILDILVTPKLCKLSSVLQTGP